MSRYSSFGGGSKSYGQNSTQNFTNNQSSVLLNKLACELHPTQKIKAICLKENCENQSRLACFQCMTSTHTDDSKYFVSVKEIRSIKPKEDVFQVYNYPTDLLEENAYAWIREYQVNLQKSEEEITQFYEDLKKNVFEQLEENKRAVLEVLAKKKEVVDEHVENLKKSVNSTFSLEVLKSLIGDISSGTIGSKQFNDEVQKFLADEKKGKVRSNIQGDVESVMNLYNFGFLTPILDSQREIRKQLADTIIDLKNSFTCPVNFTLVKGQPSYASLSKFEFNNAEAKEEAVFQYQMEKELRIQERNAGKLRLRIQDLNENPEAFSFSLGVHSRDGGAGQEDTGNYVVFGQEKIVSKHNGEHEPKKYGSTLKRFKQGVVLEIEYNLKKSQFSVFEILKDSNPVPLFKSNSTFFECDKDDWTVNLFSKPENKFSIEIFRKSLN